MQKKLTITIDAEVYDGLHRVIGRRRISPFLNDLARPHVTARIGLPATQQWRQTRPASVRPKTGAKV